MYPPYWGRHIWNVLHILAYTAPMHLTRSNMEYYVTLYTGLLKRLPCPACSYHATKYLVVKPLIKSEDDIDTEYGRMYLLNWVNDFHNSVNKRLHAPTFTIKESITAVEKLFEQTKSIYDESKKNKTTNDKIKKSKSKETNTRLLKKNSTRNSDTFTNIIILTSSIILLSIVFYFSRSPKKRLSD